MSKRTTKEDQQLLAAVRETLDADRTRLDEDTRESLDGIRQRALERAIQKTEKKQQPGRRFGTGTSWLAGAVASSVLAVVLLWSNLNIEPDANGIPLADTSDELLMWEMMLSDMDEEFYQSLAFIEWFEEEGQLYLLDS